MFTLIQLILCGLTCLSIRPLTKVAANSTSGNLENVSSSDNSEPWGSTSGNLENVSSSDISEPWGSTSGNLENVSSSDISEPWGNTSGNLENVSSIDIIEPWGSTSGNLENVSSSDINEPWGSPSGNLENVSSIDISVPWGSTSGNLDNVSSGDISEPWGSTSGNLDNVSSSDISEPWGSTSGNLENVSSSDISEPWGSTSGNLENVSSSDISEPWGSTSGNLENVSSSDISEPWGSTSGNLENVSSIDISEPWGSTSGNSENVSSSAISGPWGSTSVNLDNVSSSAISEPWGSTSGNLDNVSSGDISEPCGSTSGNLENVSSSDISEPWGSASGNLENVSSSAISGPWGSTSGNLDNVSSSDISGPCGSTSGNLDNVSSIDISEPWGSTSGNLENVSSIDISESWGSTSGNLENVSSIDISEPWGSTSGNLENVSSSAISEPWGSTSGNLDNVTVSGISEPWGGSNCSRNIKFAADFDTIAEGGSCDVVGCNISSPFSHKRMLKETHLPNPYPSSSTPAGRLVNVGDSIINDGTDMSGGPTLQHERARRRVQRTATEFWYYISSELNKLKKDTTESAIVKKINTILSDSADYQKTLKYHFHILSNGVDEQEAWRLKESKKLGDLVQRRLQYLQNPKDCKKAKKMVCNIEKCCGYGCQLHHATFCLMMAYANQRTLILESKGWRYAAGGWESAFLPLSKTCTDRFGTSSKPWGTPELIKDVQVIELPIVDSLHPRPDYLPLSVPADLADRISRFHGDPTVWWIGQFVKYLTRPQNHLAKVLDESVERLKFNNPIVGVHVRRTDKVGSEAEFHAIEEYMQFVEEWFDAYEMRHSGVKRKVFLATDDPGVLNDAKSKYPHYTFISDNEVSKSAGLSSRYTDKSLRGVIHDIHMLSLCDYLVCTFSSQVCRVAYELMQPMHGDASQWFKSLDETYYFGGQNGRHMVAVQSHQPGSKGQEIALAPGDMVGIAGNNWGGYSKGKNNRNGQAGLFPSYKVEERIVKVKLPTYPEVPDTE